MKILLILLTTLTLQATTCTKITQGQYLEGVNIHFNLKGKVLVVSDALGSNKYAYRSHTIDKNGNRVDLYLDVIYNDTVIGVVHSSKPSYVIIRDGTDMYYVNDCK